MGGEAKRLAQPPAGTLLPVSQLRPCFMGCTACPPNIPFTALLEIHHQ